MKQKDYKPPAFPFYVKDWLTSKWVTTAPAEEIRVYLMLLSFMWLENDTSLDYDKEYLARICFTQVAIIEQLASNKLTIKGLKISDKKLKEIKEGLREKHDKRVGAAEKRWSKEAVDSMSNAYAMHDAKEIETATEVVDVSNKEVLSNNKCIVFFEKNFGMLTPYLCSELTDLQQEHGEDNLLKALKITAEAGKRSIRYTKGILDNEKGNGYTWEKIAKEKENPLFKGLRPGQQHLLTQMMEKYRLTNAEEPTDGHIKIMITKITNGENK